MIDLPEYLMKKIDSGKMFFVVTDNDRMYNGLLTQVTYDYLILDTGPNKIILNLLHIVSIEEKK